MKDWLAKLEPKWVATNIIGWGFLAVVMYSVFVHMILPAQDRNFKTMDKVAETQAQLVQMFESIVRIQAEQSPKIDRIDRNTTSK